MDKKLIQIGEAAKMLNVSINTLRRWDEAGTLKSIRVQSGGNRYYNLHDIALLANDLFSVGKDWVLTISPKEPDNKFYCADSSIFQARLHKLESQLQNLTYLKDEFSLITSVVGEIGNNSFDHNLGSWIDVRGILFAYDLNKRQIVLADRGRGVLKTLKRVKPELSNDEDALLTAFTEKITGRAPELRGNGLKHVKMIVTDPTKTIPMKLFFQTGNAALDLKNGDTGIDIFNPDFSFRGCLALINF